MNPYRLSLNVPSRNPEGLGGVPWSLNILLLLYRYNLIADQADFLITYHVRWLKSSVLILSSSYSFRIVRPTALRHFFQFSVARHFPGWRCSNHILNFNMKNEEFNTNYFYSVHCHSTSHLAKPFRISNISIFNPVRSHKRPLLALYFVTPNRTNIRTCTSAHICAGMSKVHCPY